MRIAGAFSSLIVLWALTVPAISDDLEKAGKAYPTRQEADAFDAGWAPKNVSDKAPEAEAPDAKTAEPAASRTPDAKSAEAKASEPKSPSPAETESPAAKVSEPEISPTKAAEAKPAKPAAELKAPETKTSDAKPSAPKRDEAARAEARPAGSRATRPQTTLAAVEPAKTRTSGSATVRRPTPPEARSAAIVRTPEPRREVQPAPVAMATPITGGIVCGAPAKFRCNRLAPGHDKFYKFSTGHGWTDQTMATDFCASEKSMRVASATRTVSAEAGCCGVAVVQVTCKR